MKQYLCDDCGSILNEKLHNAITQVVFKKLDMKHIKNFLMCQLRKMIMFMKL